MSNPTPKVTEIRKRTLLLVGGSVGEALGLAGLATIHAVQVGAGLVRTALRMQTNVRLSEMSGAVQRTHSLDGVALRAALLEELGTLVDVTHCESVCAGK